MPKPGQKQLRRQAGSLRALLWESIKTLAGLKAKIKIKNFGIRAGIGPKPTIPLGKWQSGPSPGTPRAKEKIKNHFKHSQVVREPF